MLSVGSDLIREDCWLELIRKMPIPCVDAIVCRAGEFLMGWRVIPPYRNVWALLGGRMIRGESFEETAKRHCRKSGIVVDSPRFLGVYPVRFPSRHDITICMIARWKSGTPAATPELSRYRWFKHSEFRNIRPIGNNYRKMLRDWSKAGTAKTRYATI